MDKRIWLAVTGHHPWTLRLPRGSDAAECWNTFATLYLSRFPLSLFLSLFSLHRCCSSLYGWFVLSTSVCLRWRSTVAYLSGVDRERLAGGQSSDEESFSLVGKRGNVDWETLLRRRGRRPRGVTNEHSRLFQAFSLSFPPRRRARSIRTSSPPRPSFTSSLSRSPRYSLSSGFRSSPFISPSSCHPTSLSHPPNPLYFPSLSPSPLLARPVHPVSAYPGCWLVRLHSREPAATRPGRSQQLSRHRFSTHVARKRALHPRGCHPFLLLPDSLTVFPLALSFSAASSLCVCVLSCSDGQRWYVKRERWREYPSSFFSWLFYSCLFLLLWSPCVPLSLFPFLLLLSFPLRILLPAVGDFHPVAWEGWSYFTFVSFWVYTYFQFLFISLSFVA